MVATAGRSVVVDVEQLGGVLGLLAGFGDHHRDRVADVAHLADGEHRVRRLRHRRAVLVVDLPAAGQAADAVGRHVGAGIDRDHAGGGLGGCRVDCSEARVRAVGAADDRVELAGPVDVVGVVAVCR